MTSNRSHLTKIYLALIPVYLLGELLVSFLPIRPYRTQMEILTDYQVDRASDVRGGDIVLLGDSSLGNAVDEKLLSELTGDPCHNLALVALFGPQADEVMLRHILSEGATPSAVVLIHNPTNWNHKGGDEAISYVVDVAGPPSLDRLATRTFGHLPSVERSRSYKSIFFTVQTGLRYDLKPYQRALKKEGEALRRIYEVGYIPQDGVIKMDSSNPGTFGDFSPYPNAADQIRKTLNVAKKKDIPVFIAPGPFWDAQVSNSSEFVTALGAWLQGITEEYDNVSLLYEGVPGAPEPLIGDTLEHLNDEGSEAFTRWVAPILRARLDGDRTPIPANSWMQESR